MNKVLVADVGGTNIRFGIAEDKKVRQVRKYVCNQFQSMEKAIKTYLGEIKETPRQSRLI